MHFRAQCEHHFFSFQANGQTLELILSALPKPLFWFTFPLTRTLEKFVGTKSHSRCETSLLFSHPLLCSPLSSPGWAPQLQLSSGVASFLAGHLLLRLGAAPTRAQRAPAFLEPRSPPLAGPPCLVHPTPVRIWEEGAPVKGPSLTELLLLPLLREHLSKHHSHNKGIFHKLTVSVPTVN